jgi:hypothetical protein
LTQLVECTGYFAAVLAAECFDDIGIEQGRRRERLLDVLITCGAFKCLGGASG